MTARTAFRKKMEAVCSRCTASTVTTYVHNVFRLARVHDPKVTDTLPKGHAWITSKGLLDKVSKMKLGPRRILSLAAVKALHAFGAPKSEKWSDMMKKSSEEYDDVRDKRMKTPREQARWPKKGYDSLKIAADKLRGETQKYFNGVKTLSELYQLQRYVIMRLYSLHALRLDWADVKLSKPDKEQTNFLYKDSRKGWQLIMRKYKTAKVMGQQNIKLSRAASLVLTMFVPIVKDKTTHGYLLSTKSGKKLSRKGLSNLLSRTTEKYIGKRISAQIIRVLKATKYKKQTEEAAEIAQEMLHSKEQHLQYTKKEK